MAPNNFYYTTMNAFLGQPETQVRHWMHLLASTFGKENGVSWEIAPAGHCAIIGQA